MRRKRPHDPAPAGLFEGLDVVIHLAAYTLALPFPEQGGLPDARLICEFTRVIHHVIAGPHVVFKNNVEGTYNVLEECVRANVKR